MQEMKHQITGQIQRDYFLAPNQTALNAKMDVRKKELEGQGYTLVRRVKIGRNAPCPCGSGKKFKKCHINETR